MAHDDNGTLCTIDIDGKFTIFRITSVRPYFRDEHTIEPPAEDTSDDHAADKDDAADEDYRPKPEASVAIPRRRGRPPGSKNKPKNPASGTHTSALLPAFPQSPKEHISATKAQATWELFVTQKELKDAELAIKLRREGKITAPGKPFEASRQAEIDGLIGRGVFRFEPYNPTKHGGIRIFKSRFVDEIKGKATDKPHEKSRLMIQGYGDNGKFIILTQNPTVQRFSQRVLLSIALALLQQGFLLWLRNVTQAYT
jgi:hypothetical protein